MSSEFCPKCGTHRAGAFRFCPKCGLDFDAEAVSSEGLAEPIYDPAPNPAHDLIVEDFTELATRLGA